MPREIKIKIRIASSVEHQLFNNASITPLSTCRKPEAHRDTAKGRFRSLRYLFHTSLLTYDCHVNVITRLHPDFEKLKTMVGDAPCYILFSISSPSGWLVITYIPETVKVCHKRRNPWVWIERGQAYN